MRDGDRIMAFGVGFALMTVLGTGVQGIGFAMAAGSPLQGYVPSDDSVALEAGGAYLIDVLANDAGLPAGAGDRLLILVNPACGRASRVSGKISYTLDDDCFGAQTLTYCVPSGDACPAATLTVNVMPAPGSAADPVLSAGAPTRNFARDGATPSFAPDPGGDGGFLGAGALPQVGAVGADAPRRIPAVAATRPAPALRPAPAPARAEPEIDDSTPSFSAIAAVSAPTERKKPARKPRSVYASPDLDTPAIERPRRGADVGMVAGAPKTDGVDAGAPAARVRLTETGRAAPGAPAPDDAAPAALPTGPQPRLSVMGHLASGSLADRDGGVPTAPFMSQLAEFREIVTLAAAPEPDWSLPAPGHLARVAALSVGIDGWAIDALRDGPPMWLPPESLEPLAGLAASITPILAPDSFYRMVSLDPHSRHLRPADPAPADAPDAGARPAAQAREATEPLPTPLAALSGRADDLAAAPDPAAAPAGAAAAAAAPTHAAAAAPLPFPEREDPIAAQLQEPTEPLPPLLARADVVPALLTGAAWRAAPPTGAAFRASALAAPLASLAPAQADRAAVEAPARELTEPLPPALADWRAYAADMPPLRVSVNQTISGARNMPGQSRRNFQVLSGEGAQPLRLVLLDQRPGDLDRAERTEPLPVNLRRLRTFPPLLSQRVRLTPDFYGVPRMGFRVRRYEELASLGIAARPASVFEREMAPRHVAPDANPPRAGDVGVAAAGAGPMVALAPAASRRPFETAPAPSAPFWPETGLQTPLRGAPADGADADLSDAAVQLASLDPTENSAGAGAGAAPAASPLAAEASAPVDCPLEFSAFPASGGMMQLEATSPCRAGRVAVLHMDDLRIALRFDADGRIANTVPGAGRDLSLELVTADGVSATASLTLLDAATVERVALVWDGPVDLNLHAFEFGAAPGAEGHVWAGGEPDARGYRRGVAGFVSSFPALDGLGQSVEFYSFNPGRRSPVGRIAMAVEFASRGPVPQAPYCGGDPLASPSFRILRFNRGVADRGAARLFEAAACDAALTENSIYLRDLVQDILVVGR